MISTIESAFAALDRFDGQLPLRISLRTRRLAKVRFVFTLLDAGGRVVVRETYTCHALRIAAARGCPRR